MDLYYQEHDVPVEQRPGNGPTSASGSNSTNQQSEGAPTLLQIASTLATLSATTTPAERIRLQTHLTGLLTRLSLGNIGGGNADGTGSGASGTPPTSAAFLRALPRQTSVPPSGTVCPVCTEEFGSAERAVYLPCRHFFHTDCVLPWLSAHSTCPVCRLDLPTDDPAYEERKRLARREKAVSQMRAQMFN